MISKELMSSAIANSHGDLLDWEKRIYSICFFYQPPPIVPKLGPELKITAPAQDAYPNQVTP